MNLADAIRKASVSAGQGAEDLHFGETAVNRPDPATELLSEATFGDELGFEAGASERLAPLADHGTGGGLLRLESLLPPDQLHRLFRYVASTQHSVMTLREAASHLRITTSRLEQLALERQIPAFLVDGKWRFSRARLEEWLEHSGDKEQAS